MSEVMNVGVMNVGQSSENRGVPLIALLCLLYVDMKNPNANKLSWAIN